MKRLKLFLPLVVMILLAGGVFVYFYGGPFRLKQVSIQAKALQRLQAGAGASTPVDAAYEYLFGWSYPSDRPKREQLEIKVRQNSADEAIVTIVNRRTLDDSTFVTYDRLALLHQQGVWLPVRHQAAWQGRGRIGWTTKPTL